MVQKKDSLESSQIQCIKFSSMITRFLWASHTVSQPPHCGQFLPDHSLPWRCPVRRGAVGSSLGSAPTLTAVPPTPAVTAVSRCWQVSPGDQSRPPVTGPLGLLTRCPTLISCCFTTYRACSEPTRCAGLKHALLPCT